MASKIWQTLRLGLKSLLLHKLRSGLAILGILIGVTAVIWLVAMGEGVSYQAQQQIKDLGANNIIVRSTKPPSDVTRGGAWHIGVLAAPGIPEMLLTGREREFLEYVYSTMTAVTGAIPPPTSPSSSAPTPVPTAGAALSGSTGQCCERGPRSRRLPRPTRYERRSLLSAREPDPSRTPRCPRPSRRRRRQHLTPAKSTTPGPADRGGSQPPQVGTGLRGKRRADLGFTKCKWKSH